MSRSPALSYLDIPFPLCYLSLRVSSIGKGKEMRGKILLLRCCYWIGAVADALSAIIMVSPTLGGSIYGIPDFHPGAEYRYAMGLGASLMIGWTFLLIWADRRPLERRGVLLLTVFPVLLGLIISGIYAVTTGLIAAERMVPTWIFQGMVTGLYLFSYFYTRGLKPHKT
jgi:hypothetical protein